MSFITRYVMDGACPNASQSASLEETAWESILPASKSKVAW